MTFSSSTQFKSQSITDLLPGSVEGWTLYKPDKIYTSETLYDYIDGGAELYLSYGMKEVASRIITQVDNEIRIEIFDMVEAKNAFGVFTHTRTHDEKLFGQGSQYFTGTQIFWKDNYFIAITANDENESIINTIQCIATEIDSRIHSSGEIPQIVDLIPEMGLEADGYLYFHHYIWLNSYYYIANDNFLNIGPDTDAILAKYHLNDRCCFLLIVKYSGAEIASEAENAFRKQFMEPENILPYERIEDGSWIGVDTKEQYLLMVLNAFDSETVIHLIQQAEENIIKP